MDVCYICLEFNNLIKICKCNFYVHQTCGNELLKTIKTCTVCNYEYKFTQYRDNKKIINNFITNLFDFLLANLIFWNHIYTIYKFANYIHNSYNKIGSLLILIYILILIITFITYMIFIIIWKHLIINNYIFNNNNILSPRLREYFNKIYNYNYTITIVNIISCYVQFLFKILINLNKIFKIIVNLLLEIIKYEINKYKYNVINSYKFN